MNPESIRRETEEYLHEKIPITRAMGVVVESISPDELVLTAPLEANHNHLGTAFGGSLGAIATLAGYGFLWIQLGDRDAHLVIKQSSIRYLHSVRGEIRAICRAPDAGILAEFGNTFARKDKARIRLGVTIEGNGRVCVEFEGEFVAMR
jgi:thioesterase domain-containing protein